MFKEIDEDKSEAVEVDEVLRYLDSVHTERLRIVAARPSTFGEWAWAVAGIDDTTFPPNDKGAWIPPTFQAFMQIVILLSIILIVVESMPSMQPDEKDGLPRGTAPHSGEIDP